MKHHLCRVIENRALWQSLQLLTLNAPELTRAMRSGQFALARDPLTFDPYLRRTLWKFQVHGECIAFTLNADDPLAIRARVGGTLDLLAPLGRAIDFEPNQRHVLLIGDGVHIARLVPIANDAVMLGREVVLISIGDSSEESASIFPPQLLPPEVEYRTDAELNSELIAWADAVIACGSSELYRVVREALRTVRYRVGPGFARALLELPMPCGIGVCYACAVETSRGLQLACVDGPAFNLVELPREGLG